jgi:Protein of unknown function (DUF4230)
MYLLYGGQIVPGKPRGKKKHRFINPGISILLLLFLSAAALYLLSQRFNFNLPFIYNTKSSSTEIILTEINKVSTLSTVEYIYKSVFPFDFLAPDTNWRKLLIKQSKNEYLTNLEDEQLELYNMCKAIGINLENEIYDFVIITSIVKAGINWDDKIIPGDINIEGKNITIRMPDSIITSFTIEDSDSTTYKYPDLDVSPIYWKQITAYVEEKIKIRVLEDGILKIAEERVNEFITSLLIDSGWEKINFIQ